MDSCRLCDKTLINENESSIILATYFVLEILKVNYIFEPGKRSKLIPMLILNDSNSILLYF